MWLALRDGITVWHMFLLLFCTTLSLPSSCVVIQPNFKCVILVLKQNHINNPFLLLQQQQINHWSLFIVIYGDHHQLCLTLVVDITCCSLINTLGSIGYIFVQIKVMWLHCLSSLSLWLKICFLPRLKPCKLMVALNSYRSLELTHRFNTTSHVLILPSRMGLSKGGTDIL
jgi:hypothetical protein